MIKFRINENKNNEHCFQVLGNINLNGKDYKAKFFVFADDEKDAKEKLKTFQQVRLMKYNLQTFADAQRAYKKEFGTNVELDSEEFIKYIKS